MQDPQNLPTPNEEASQPTKSTPERGTPVSAIAGAEATPQANLEELSRSDSTFVSNHGEPSSTLFSQAEASPASAPQAEVSRAQMYAQRYGVSPSEGEGAAPQETPAANLTPSYAPTPEGGTLESTPSFSESNLKNAPTPAPQPDGVEPPNISRKEIRKSYQAQVVKIFFKDMLIVIVAAMVLTLVLKTFVFQPFGVPSSSMENTLKPDDRILVSKVSLLRGIQRGDVVVFRDTKGWLRGEPTPKNPDSGPFGAVLKFIGFAPEDDDEFLVKRVIGIPGDTVSCKGGNAPLLVNGQEISNEPFLKPGAAHSSFSFDVTVPEGQLWVMGDNRPVSADSRLNTDKPGRGFVDEKDVVGIVFMRVWPQSRFGFLDDERKVFADVPKDAPSGDSE